MKLLGVNWHGMQCCSNGTFVLQKLDVQLELVQKDRDESVLQWLGGYTKALPNFGRNSGRRRTCKEAWVGKTVHKFETPKMVQTEMTLHMLQWRYAVLFQTQVCCTCAPWMHMTYHHDHYDKTSLDHVCWYKSLCYQQKDVLLFADRDLIKASHLGYWSGLYGQFEWPQKSNLSGFPESTFTSKLSMKTNRCIPLHSTSHGPEQFHLCDFWGTRDWVHLTCNSDFAKVQILKHSWIQDGQWPRLEKRQGSRQQRLSPQFVLSTEWLCCADHGGPHIHSFKTAVCHGKIDSFFFSISPVRHRSCPVTPPRSIW